MGWEMVEAKPKNLEESTHTHLYTREYPCTGQAELAAHSQTSSLEHERFSDLAGAQFGSSIGV